MYSVAQSKSEWRKYWYLPLVAAIGYSSAGLHIYGLGAFVGPLGSEFKWNRVETFAGSALVSLVVALLSLPIGAMVDVIGPRRVAMTGVVAVSGAIALLSTATGSTANWMMLWALVALCATMVQAPIWTTAVVSRFDASRGLAIGITLCGGSIPIFALPLLATILIEAVGWRQAFIGLGALWGVILFPIVALFFRGARDDQGRRAPAEAAVAQTDGVSLGTALRTPTLHKLMFAAGFFALAILGLVVHFVPMLTDAGMTPLMAAAAASLIGIFSIVGRLCTGIVLDRFSPYVIGAVSFLLPILGCAIVLIELGGTARFFVAAILFGLSLGAETDVIPYLASRQFGLRNFGAIQGALHSAIAIGSASGPLTAGLIFDRFGSYTPFLVATSIAMLASAVLIFTLRPRRN